MNRKKRVQLIIRVLLAPFTEPPFQAPDRWEAKTRAYQQMKQTRPDGDFKKNRELYRQSRRALIQSLEERIFPDRISELEQLLDFFYPDDELNDFLLASDTPRLDVCFLNKLRKIAMEFITLRDGRVSLRMWNREDPDGLFPGLSQLFKAELWSELSRTIPPDVLIASYFCECRIDDKFQLAGLPDAIFLSDMPLLGIQKKGVAETHAHFSACMSYLSVWEAVTDLTALRIMSEDIQTILQKRQMEEFNQAQSLLAAAFLRLMLAKYLESDCEDDILMYYGQDGARAPADLPKLEWQFLRHVLAPGGPPDPIESFAGCVRSQRVEFLRHLYKTYDLTNEPSLDILLRGPYRKYAGLHTSPELLLLHAALCHVRDHGQHTQFACALMCYLRIKNHYFRSRLQAVGLGGLTFFRRYFAAATRSLTVRNDTDREQRRLIYRAAFRNQLRCPNLRKLEIKLTPNIPADQDQQLPFTRPANQYRRDKRAIAEQLHGIFQCFLDVCGENPSSDRFPTLGVVYHFIKEDMRYLPVGRCWIPEAEQDPVTMIRSQQERFVNALNELLGEVEYLSEYVVGLDAASEEIYTEPWIYAPVFQKARSGENTFPRQPGWQSYRQNLGFTYHVGEDYHHILSGLRHIDEVLTYFGYRPGDRIGHGLALQVNLEEWLRNNEVVAIPIMEHLENMLWLWACCGQGNRELGGILPQLENEIMSRAQEIYYNVRGLSPYVLWKAYTRKFEWLKNEFCQSMQAMYLQQKSDPPQPPLPDMQRSFCALHRGWRLPGQTDVYPDAVWDIDKLLLTHYCPVYQKHYQRQILVASPASYLDIFSAMQKYVRQKVRKAGIYVETNPTSNLSIGDVSGLPGYQITTLNGRGLPGEQNDPVLISINSDNPLIFNTNVENEMAIIYHTLLSRGFGHEEVLEWMNKIRKAGMSSSFIRTYKDMKTQRAELESMIHKLESYFPPLSAKELRCRENRLKQE